MTHRLDTRDEGGAVAPWLQSLHACRDAVQWCGERDLLTAWRECERADWMLWLCGKNADTPGWPTRRQLVLAACACAETALPFVREGEERPRRALEMARRWARDDAAMTLAEVRATARDAVYGASYAAAAAVYAAVADADAAGYAAACAAEAAYAADSAAARTRTLRELAELLRRPETWR